MNGALIDFLGVKRIGLNPRNSRTPYILYGAFDATGSCHYVGSTFRPRTRLEHHKARFAHLRFLIFRWAHDPMHRVLEKQIIRAYQKRGQAKYNKYYSLN